MNNSNNPHQFCIPLGSIAAAGNLPGTYLAKNFVITSVALINNATLTASDTDYIQVSLKNGATVVAEMDSRAAHEGTVTALVGKLLNLVAGQEEQAAASSLSVAYAEGGTITLTSAVLAVSGYYR